MDRKSNELQRISSKNNTKSKGEMTLTEMAHALGYKSPSSLSMIAKGKRLPSKKILYQLFDFWNVTSRERRSIESLVKLESNLKRGKKVLSELNSIKKQNSKIQFSRISSENINLIKDWYHLALFAAIGLPQTFDHSPQYFYKLLDKKVSVGQIKKALLNLEKLNFIKKDSSSKTIRYVRLLDTISTTDDIPSEAIRFFHREMIQKSIAAIDRQTVQNRQLSALTFQIDKKQLPELKKDIQDFFSTIYEKYYQNEGDSVYQMNTQLFALINENVLRKNKLKDSK